MEFVSSGETHHLILSPDQWRKILNEKFIEFEKEFDFKINSNENVAEIIFPVYVSQDDQEWIKKIGGMTVGQLLDFIEKIIFQEMEKFSITELKMIILMDKIFQECVETLIVQMEYFLPAVKLKVGEQQK